MDGDHDHTKQEGRNENNDDEEQKTHSHTSISKISDGSAFSKDTADETFGSDDHMLRSQSGANVSDAVQHGQDEGASSRLAGGDKDQTKEKAEIEFENTGNDQNYGRQSSEQKLSHPNILKLEGFVEDLSSHKVWLLFPWEEHGNLRDFLASGEWEIPERLSLINDVTLGLEYLHSGETPIYHGDLKSLNILVNSVYSAVIADFGSARRLGEEASRKQVKRDGETPQPTGEVTTGDESITVQALFSGTTSTITLSGNSYTIRWAAPELLKEEQPCLRSDIWALGWIAYEVMTNTIPFHDIKKDAIVIKHVIQGRMPSVTEDARMSLIRALCTLMLQCWSINPEKRPTAEECRKLISWMPMIVPAPTRTVDEKASQLRHAQLLNKLGQMYRRQADYVSALRCYTEALDIYTKLSEIKGRADTLLGLAFVHRLEGKYIKAVPLYSEALRIYTDIDEEKSRADAIWALAETHRGQQNYDEAVKMYSESLQIWTKIGSNRARAMALWGLADVHRLRGEYREAKDFFSEALPIFTEVGDQRERASTLCRLADVHRAQYEYDEAIKFYSEAAQILTDLCDKHWGPEALLGLARTHRMLGHHSEAIFFYAKASEVFTETGESELASDALENAAAIRKTTEGASAEPSR
ncbi:hypothetical protein FRC01_002740 [Tulasnella sp. 417]|nr:hypothetical protein FRC01_002740 [Tulasnella sp. 417]